MYNENSHFSYVTLGLNFCLFRLWTCLHVFWLSKIAVGYSFFNQMLFYDENIFLSIRVHSPGDLILQFFFSAEVVDCLVGLLG